MKLIENTEFGLQCKSKEKEFKTRLEYLDWYEKSRNNYDVFLNQPLTLGMFIACDDDGNVLEEPKGTDLNSSFFEMQVDYNLEKKYKQAKEKVLFEEVFTVKKHGENIVVYLNENSFYTTWNKSKKIEDLIYLNLTLTPNAIKQLKL